MAQGVKGTFGQKRVRLATDRAFFCAFRNHPRYFRYDWNLEDRPKEWLVMRAAVIRILEYWGHKIDPVGRGGR